MNSKEITKRGYGFKEAEVINIDGLTQLLERFGKRISVSYTGRSTSKSYRRAVRDLSLFHNGLKPVMIVFKVIHPSRGSPRKLLPNKLEYPC